MYQARRFWQQKPRSRGGGGWVTRRHSNPRSSLSTAPGPRPHGRRAPPSPPPFPHAPDTLPRRSQRLPGRSRGSRGTGASTAVECGGPGGQGGGLVAMAIGGPRRAMAIPALHPSPSVSDWWTDDHHPLGPRPTLVKTPRVRSTRLFSSWLSSQQKVWARDQRKRGKDSEEF